MSDIGRRSGGDTGAALVFVLLMLLAVVALGHGTLVSALGELGASRAAVRYLESRALAEAAVSLMLDRRNEPWMDSLPVGGVRALDSVHLGRGEALTSLRRLGPESWLIEGTGRVGPQATARTGRLAWSMEPVTRVLSLSGAVNVAVGAPLALMGTVDVSDPARTDPPLVLADCEPWLADIVGHYTTAPLEIASAPFDSLTGARLGLLDVPGLLQLAEVTVEGVGTPSPAERLGECQRDEPWGWGDPERPTRPCGPHLPLRASPGDLSVVGGTGQGVLAVEGDLTLTAGARFYGLLITDGTLHLEGGASVEGLAIARAGVVELPGSRIVASACWVMRALVAQRATMSRLRLVPGVGEVGPL